MTKAGLLLAVGLLLAACDEEATQPEPVESNPNAEKTLTGPMTGVYKYVDSHGVINYVDSIEKVPPRYRKRAVHPTGGAVSIVPSSNIDNLLDKHGLDSKAFRGRGKAAGRHGQVIVYSTSWCPACKIAKTYLRKKGVSFTVKDVERNKANLKEMLSKSGGARGVPVIDIRGKILRGFNSHKIDQALKS